MPPNERGRRGDKFPGEPTHMIQKINSKKIAKTKMVG
jgi:hypothetical protein